MSDFLYYCAECNSLVADVYEDSRLACDKCGATMTPLYIDEDEWYDMSKDEMRSFLLKYRTPSRNTQKKQTAPQSQEYFDEYEERPRKKKNIKSRNNNHYHSTQQKHQKTNSALYYFLHDPKIDRICGILGIIILIIGLSVLGIIKVVSNDSDDYNLNGPEKIVSDYSKGIQAYDLKKTNSCFLNPDEDTSNPLDNKGKAFKTLSSYYKKQAKKMKFQILGSQINGDEASVDVKYTYTDASDVLSSAISDYSKQGLALAFSGASNDEMASLLFDIFEKKAKKEKAGTAECTITIQCVNTADGWKISYVPDDMQDVLMCNMLKTFKKVM